MSGYFGWNISRALRFTSSHGTGFTLPESISSMRRATSCCHASSTSKSGLPSSRLSIKWAAGAPLPFSGVRRLQETWKGSTPQHNLLIREKQEFWSGPLATSPFSFQQLTSAQSCIQPLNPVFLPFVGIKMRNSLPSNSITIRHYPGKSVRTRTVKSVQFSGELQL